MPGEPIQHDGAYWLQEDNGTWLRWNGTAWVDPNAGIAAPSPGAPTGQQATQSYQASQQAPSPPAPAYAAPPAPTPSAPYGTQQIQAEQPDAPRGKGPLFAILGVAVLAIVAIAIFAMASGGGGSSSGGSEAASESDGGTSASSGASNASSSTTSGTGKNGATVSGSGKASGWEGSLQYQGKGPNGYDNGQKLACTGAKGGSPSVLCVRAGGNGQGTAAAPFGSINAAIAAASAKDVIQVAAGTYAENVAVGKFDALAKTELTILGGFSSDFSTRDASKNRSVIDGKGSAPAVQIHVQGNGKTVLDGFRITNGKGLGTTFETGNGVGGGVFATQGGNGELAISHNEVYNNQTNKFEDAQRGGGIFTNAPTDDGKPTIRIEDNVVHSNQAGRGAGITVTGRQATILRNVIEGNKSHSDHGGGLYVSTSATDIGDNVIRGNEVGTTVKYGWGGGVIIAAANAEMHGNIVTGNYAPSLGSGVFWDEGAKGTMKEDVIFANGCPNEAGWGVYADGGAGPSMLTLDHVTVANHNCPNATGAAITAQDLSKITVKDSIIWGNTKEFSVLEKGTFTVSNSISATSGNGNKNSDPQFVDPSNGDFRLKAGSSASGLGAYPK